MADPRGFLRTRERELPPDRPVDVRVRDWDEVHRHPTGEPGALALLTRQASRCMDCGVPFCHHACCRSSRRRSTGVCSRPRRRTA